MSQIEDFLVAGSGQRAASDIEHFLGGSDKRELTFGQSIDDFLGGVEQVKALGAGAAAYGASLNIKPNVDALADMDAIDAGGQPQARAGGVDAPARPTDMARMYAAADPATRQKLREHAAQSLMGSQEFIGKASDAVKAYNAEQQRLSGNLPNFTDIETAKDFGRWAVRNSIATSPTMAASMIGALAGPAGLAATSLGMATGDMTSARLKTADEQSDPSRFTNPDRIDEATHAKNIATSDYLSKNAGNTAALSIPYAALDFLGPAGTLATQGIKGLASTGIKGFLTGAAKEIGGEAINEGGQEVVNVASDMLAGERPSSWTGQDTERVINSAAVGGIMGAGGHAVNTGAAAGRDAFLGKKKDEPLPPTVGRPTPTAPSPAPTITAVEPTAEPVSEAETALRAPASLTSLDRVNEIDAERDRASERLAELSRPEAGYGPMFDGDRSALVGKLQGLAQERADLTRDWPSVVAGAPTTFSTEAGARVEGQYALADVNDLVTSHDEGLRANPTYPQEMQPRERDRAASELQVAGIVQKLDPARLGLSADAATGAPIVGADGLVESGNARTIALKRIYRVPGQKAADYKAFLRDNAAQFGLTPEAVDAVEKPVLVRVRTTPVNRAEFARQANASTVAAMSPSEQARADAKRIDSMEDLTPDDSGDFANAASRPFVSRFMARLPGTEQSGLVDANGRLSSAGYARVRNAVLAKAYGDSPVLQRMTESLDDNLRNISKALITAAPRVAQIRQAIAQGDRFDSDITPDLMEAVEELSAIKESGGSVADAMAQGDMLGDKHTPEARQLVQFLADNIRRPRRMADFITAYMEALDAAGNPKQGSLLGAAEAPRKTDLMGAARRSIDDDYAAETQADSERGNARQDAQAADALAGRPEDAARGGRGDQGNGAVGAAAEVRVGPDTSPAAEGAQGAEHGNQGQEGQGRGRQAEGLLNPQAGATQEAPAPTNNGAPENERRDWKGRALNVGDNVSGHGRFDTISRWGQNAENRWIAYNTDGRVIGRASGLEFVQIGAKEAPAAPNNGDWVAFAPDSGTLGIPRAEMPQVKSKDRGALVLFLKGRGIDHETVELPAKDLKPTQAEFSPKKVEGWKEARDGVDRSVLASSDGYILDGHHQWVAASAANESEKVIRFNAPIRDLLAAVKEFPSVERSKGAPDLAAVRERAMLDFKDALGDLAQIASKHTRVAFLPEDTSGLMPALVKAFEAAIKIVGTDLKRATAWVKAEMKADERLKKLWNKIGGDTYRKAAMQALDNLERAGEQGDLASAPKVAMIDGRPYNFDKATGDNFKMPSAGSFLPAELVQRAKAYIAEFRSSLQPVAILAEERASAEAMVRPMLAAAEKVKASFDEKVIAITRASGAIGQLIPPNLKSLDRAAEKVFVEKLTPEKLRDLLRATVVVSSFDDAQSVVDAIYREFSVVGGRVKNRTDRPITAPDLDPDSGFLPSGYGDVLVNVMHDGVQAEIIISVPEMLSAKDAEGQQLYEIERTQPDGSEARAAVIGAQKDYYYAAAEVASARALDTKDASDKTIGSESGGQTGARTASEPIAKNAGSPGFTNAIRPDSSSKNLVPSGNLAGTFIAPPPASIVPESGLKEYNSEAGGTGNVKDASARRNDQVGDEGQGAEPARRAAGQRSTQAVRDGRGAGDSQRSGRPGDESAQPGEVGQPAAGRVIGGDADAGGGVAEHGDAAVRGKPARERAGIPAGRDIPLKSGRNYRFTDDDLTYTGSWQKKAEANVVAVELLKALEAEGRQATREEQKTLAGFIGWGSSEIANNLFGDKLDKQIEVLRNYDEAIENLAGREYLDNANYTRYRPAFMVLQSKKPELNWYTSGRITKAMLDAAKPPASVQRWAALRDRLKAVLTPEQWAEASRSTQYAHYTSKPVVSSMWNALSRFGFKGGVVLEPGAGNGIFPGLMPEAMAVNSLYTGIEYDSITGAILKQLQPDERILVESFVDSKLPANFYDVAIGNPPFSGTKILGDTEYRKHAFSLHDYFFAKTIDRVKPGGLVIFVTSRYTMDKQGDKARQYLAERSDMVGAIRLPQTAFKANAGTEVVTDVLFLRKKVPGQTFEHGKEWLKAVPTKTKDGAAIVNEYFDAHPEMVLGTPALQGSMYSKNEYTVLAPEGNIEDLFAQAVEKLPADIYTAERGSAAEAAQVREIDFNPKAQKEGNYYLSDAGALMQREGGVGQRVDSKKPKDVEVIKAFVPLRDALKQAHFDQLNDADWESSLKALQGAYKTFTKAHGQVNQFTTKTVKIKVAELDDEGNPTGRKVDDEELRRSYTLIPVLQDDPDYTLVMALEKVDDETGAITQGPFLTSRVLGKPESPQIATASDALLSVLNDIGNVDLPTIAHRIGLSEADAIDALGTAIYKDPEAAWTTSDEYLSGNVKHKLDVARAAAKADRAFDRNVQALEAAQPAPKRPSEISPSIGMNWIPGADYAKFLNDTAGVTASVRWNEPARKWVLGVGAGTQTMRAMTDWGAGGLSALDLLDHALTGRPIRVTRQVGHGSEKTTVFDAPATEAANAKMADLKKEFEAWVWRDPERTDRLVRIYNDKFNTTVARSFNGDHLTLPGASKQFNIFPHVKRGAWRIIQTGNTYLAHAVGSGKTFQAVISAMEQKRLGFIKKPMMVVPNHMLQQFAREWQELYPAARLMVADENNFHTENRRRFVSRVALSDLDGVIITHSAFKILDLDPKFKAKMIDEQLTYLRASLEQSEEEDGQDKKGKSSPRVKQIEKQIENLEEKLKDALSSEGKDKNARFDELGVDFLYVDEAHEMRKLEFGTSRQVKGIQPAGSARAFDLYMKSRYLEEKTPGRSLVMMSGTPITNTLAELYTVSRFMDRQALIDRGIEDFDSWAAMFGREATELETNAGGTYEPVTRFTRFVNVPELTQMFREFADVVTGDELASILGDMRPKIEGGSRKIVITPKTDDYAMYQKMLAVRVEKSRAWKPSKQEPNNPDPIIKIIGDGRLAAIDMRFIWPDHPSDPSSKLNMMANDIIEVFKQTADFEYVDKAKKPEPNKGGSMMVFSDLGFGAGAAANRGFNARAWFEKRLRDGGVPIDKVAFMSDYKKSTAKAQLFKDVNAGRTRILIGSSKNMGTGVNAQRRLKALFHLDSPWFPADLEQREGRIIRTGNQNKEVAIFGYGTKGSYDEVMWKMLVYKQKFIDQALSGDDTLREIDDLSSASQFEQISAMLADDPRVLQLSGAKAEVEKLGRLYRAHEDQRAMFRDQYRRAADASAFTQDRLAEAERIAGQVQDLSGDNFRAKVGKATFNERAKWGAALIDEYKKLAASAADSTQIGEIAGFPVSFVALRGASSYSAYAALKVGHSSTTLVNDGSESPVGIAMRAQNGLSDAAREPARMRQSIAADRAKMDALAPRLETPFPMAGMLADKVKEVQSLEAELAAEGKAKKDAKEAAQAQEAPAPSLSRGAGGGMDVKSLRALASRIKAAMPNMPDVKVLADPSEAPTKLREYIEKQGAWNDVEGAMHDGQLYLFASGLIDEARAEHVLAEHEVAHVGLRAVLGKALPSVMNMVYANNATVRRAALALQANGKLTDAEAAEEVIVDLPSSGLVSLKGWRKVTVAVRDALAERGFTRTAEKLTNWLNSTLDDQQRADLFVANLVRAARGYVAGKQVGARGGTATARAVAGSPMSMLARGMMRGMPEANDAPGHNADGSGADSNRAAKRKFGEFAEFNARGDLRLVHGSKSVVSGPLNLAYAGKKANTEGYGAYFATDPANAKLFGKNIAPLELPKELFDQVIDLEGRYSEQDAYVQRAMRVHVGKLTPDETFASAKGYIGLKMTANDDLRAVVHKITRSNVKSLRSWVDSLPKGPRRKHLESEFFGESDPLMWDVFQRMRLLHGSARRVAAVLQNSGIIGATFKASRDLYVRNTKANNVLIWDQPTLNGRGVDEWLNEQPAPTSGGAEHNPGSALSRAVAANAPQAALTPAQRAEAIIQTKAASRAPLELIARGLSRVTGVERMAGAVYRKAGFILDRYTPEVIKAGFGTDYGVPEAVKDQRALLPVRQRVQLRQAGALVDKLSMLTRAESRVAYAWMNEADPTEADRLEKQLPEESVKVLRDVRQMVDSLSRDAVSLGQLSPEAFKRNRFAYLRRSYAKYVMEQNSGDKAKRARVISILGEQYKGRGLTELAAMAQIKNAAPDWWKRKTQAGKADASLKGAQLIRLEKHAPSGEGTQVLDGMTDRPRGKLLEVNYFPSDEALPAKYADWDKAGTFEVRDIKGGDAVLWRDFTKAEREKMGEIDEARFAIAKTLHGMIHDVEVGRYLEWLAHNQALKEGQEVPGTVVDASERYRDTFKPGEWVRVPDTKISGTSVLKYGKLAGRYLPGPVWNDLRQTVSGNFKPFGDTYAKVLGLWKTSKTALSPAVHLNNVMANFVMADWHDVGAAHVSKALRLILAAHDRSGKGALGRAGNALARGGISDREAALEVLNRYKDSGGDIGGWVGNEIATEQLAPLLASLEAELATTDGNSVQAQAGVMASLQHALHLRFPTAWDSLKASRTAKVVGTEAKTMIELYQSEDDVFRLAAWLREKENGADDLQAGKVARKSFLDYRINAPWIQAMRNSGWPFISFTYRAVPMLLDTFGNKPHKILKLMALAGAVNALGVAMGGGDDDKERKLLPEEKAGRVWGMVPKLIRMPWNDANGSPVYLDIRRFIPVGDVLDVGQGHSAVPLLPGLVPGGPLVVAGEILLNRSAFTGKEITLETDTSAQQAQKVSEYLYKAFMPNLLGVPGTYATTGVVDAVKGKTDAFGREQSVPQAVASSFGLKLGSYPADVLLRNLQAKMASETMEIDRNIAGLRRQLQINKISAEEYRSKVLVEQEKKAELYRELSKKLH